MEQGKRNYKGEDIEYLSDLEKERAKENILEEFQNQIDWLNGSQLFDMVIRKELNLEEVVFFKHEMH